MSARSNTATVTRSAKPAAKATPTKPRTPRKPKATAPKATPTPKAPPVKQAPSNCGCGCGKPTITAKAAFLSGHDARHAGVLGRAFGTGTATPEMQAAYDRLTDRLKEKVDGIAKTAKRNQAVKDAKEAAKRAAKEAFDAAMA